jgi:hypothetical protein
MSQHTHRAVVLSAVASCGFFFGISTAQAGGVAATIAKAFNPAAIAAGGTSTITFTLGNANVAVALTNASFTDTLSGMAISGAQAAAGTCAGAGTNNFADTATALSFSGITIPANGNCTVTVLVTSSTAGANPNSTSGVSNPLTGLGPASNTAILTVTPLPVTLQSFDVK